jgi:3-hydroxybutyryl-CoA dehydratase
MIPGYYEDVEIGQRFESGGRTITDAYDLQFSMLSGDWHPLHTDAEYSKRSRFGQRIAHGMLTLAVASGLMILSRDSIRAFYGMDRVRFLRAVLFGDTIRVMSEIVAKDPLKDGAGTIAVQVTVVNQKDEPVMAMTMKFVVGTREPTHADVSEFQ